MHRNFEQVLNEFGQRMGIESLSLDAQGHCQLSFDTVPVHIQALDDEGRAMCYSPLGSLDADAQQFMAWELLHANFHFQQTGGASLSRNKETGLCMLSWLLDGAHVTTNALETSMTLFVNTAEYWMHRLRDAAPVEKPSHPEHAEFTPPPGPMHQRM